MIFDKKEKIQQFINFIKAIDYKSELGVYFKEKLVDQSFWLNIGNKKEPINRILSQNQLKGLIEFLEFSIEETNITFEIQFQERTSKQFTQFTKQEQLVQQSIQNRQPRIQQQLGGQNQQHSQKVENHQKQSIIQVDSIIPQKICEQTQDQILNQSSILDYQEHQSFTIEQQMLQQFEQPEIILNVDKCPKYSKESIFIKTLKKYDPLLTIYCSEPRISNSYRNYFKSVVGCNVEEWRRYNKKHVYLVTKLRYIEEFPADLEYFVEIYDAWNKFSQKKKYVLIDCQVNESAEILEIDDFGVSKIKFFLKNDAEITLKFDDDEDHRAYTEFIKYHALMLKYNPHFIYNNSFLVDRSLGSMIDNSSIIIDAEEIISQIQSEKMFEIGTKKGIVLFQYFIQKFARDNIKYGIQFQKDNRFSKFFNSYLQIVEIFPKFFNNQASTSILDDISKINIKQVPEDIVKEKIVDPQQINNLQDQQPIQLCVQDQQQNNIQKINTNQNIRNDPQQINNLQAQPVIQLNAQDMQQNNKQNINQNNNQNIIYDPQFINNLQSWPDKQLNVLDIQQSNRQNINNQIVRYDPQQINQNQQPGIQLNVQDFQQNNTKNINQNNNQNIRQDLNTSNQSSEPSTTLSKALNSSIQDQDGSSGNLGSAVEYSQQGGAAEYSQQRGDLAASFKIPDESIYQNNSEFLLQEQQSIFIGDNSLQKVQQPIKIITKENPIKISQIDYVLSIDQCPYIDNFTYQLQLEKIRAALPNNRLIFKKPQIKPEYKINFLNKAQCLTEDEMFYKIRQKFYLVTLDRQFTEFSDELVYFKYEEKAIQYFASDPKFILIQFRGLKDTKIKWVGKQHEMFKLKEANLAYPEIIIEHQKTGL